MNDRPKGQRFSFTYLSKGDLVNESKTMRFRLGKIMENKKYHHRVRNKYSGGYTLTDSSLVKDIEQEIGEPFEVYINGIFYGGWVSFCERLEIYVLLDVVTVYANSCNDLEKDDFIFQVNRIFQEEKIAFEVDDQGGIHPVIDGAFGSNKYATISGMSEPRYLLSRMRVVEIDASLMESPQNYIRAIRSVFGANENLFKLMFDMHRLDAASANQKLGPKLQAIYASHPTMQRSSAQVLQTFIKWIDAAHHYRHEQGAETPNQPADELGIIMISEGISFVRWLVAIDKKIQALNMSNNSDVHPTSTAFDE